MKRILLSLGLVLSSLVLCGLSSKYAIKVVQEEKSPISFEFEWPTRSKVEVVEVNNFFVAEKNDSGKWGYQNPMWAFHLVPGSAKPLSKIIYGQVPTGFTETAKAKPLIHGVHYIAVGLSPGSGGSVEFIAQ
jgi:hypothetical protein